MSSPLLCPSIPLRLRTHARISLFPTLPTLTHITEFQLLHTPAAFQAERIAWRIVIYLNLIRSIRRYLPLVTPARCHSFPRRTLESIATGRAENPHELPDSASLASDEQEQTPSSSTHTDSETHRIATEKYAEYSTALGPALELEALLIRTLREDDDEDEATRLGDGSAPGWSVPRGEYSVRTTSNWKRALALRRRQAQRASVSPWWEDPKDPVHVLDKSRDVMIRLWKDPWVRRRLVEKRVRLQESSGLYVSASSDPITTAAKLGHPATLTK